MSTYVSIGRNDGPDGPPMSDGRWRLFRSDVRASVAFYAGPIVSETTGRGLYGESPEETAVVVGAGEVIDIDRRGLERELSLLARAYGQETIAVAYAGVKFVEAAAGPRDGS